MNGNTYVLHPASRLWMLDDDTALLFDPVRGQVLRITRTASIILQHCDGTRTGEQIAAAMDKYGVPFSAVQSVLEKYIKSEMIKSLRGEFHESTIE